MDTQCLPGWSIINIKSGKGGPYDQYPEECELMMAFGRNLPTAVLPSFFGMTDVPPIHLFGTSGNFATRAGRYEHMFIVTARGADKRRLTPPDFIKVIYVDERNKVVYFVGPEGSQPSTDSLLVWKAFSANQGINAWAHFHLPLNEADVSLEIPYPATLPYHWAEFQAVVAKSAGRCIVNFINHDVARRGGVRVNTPDATAVMGFDAQSTFELSRSLVANVLSG